MLQLTNASALSDLRRVLEQDQITKLSWILVLSDDERCHFTVVILWNCSDLHYVRFGRHIEEWNAITGHNHRQFRDSNHVFGLGRKHANYTNRAGAGVKPQTWEV